MYRQKKNLENENKFSAKLFFEIPKKISSLLTQ